MGTLIKPSFSKLGFIFSRRVLLSIARVNPSDKVFCCFYLFCLLRAFFQVVLWRFSSDLGLIPSRRVFSCLLL